MNGETISPIEAQMDQFKKDSVDVLTWLANTYEDEEKGPLLDNTVIPLEPATLMGTSTALSEDEPLSLAVWNEEDPRHFQELSAVEQGILVGTACELFGTTVQEMQKNEVDPSEVNVVNPDAIEEGAAEQYPVDPATALTEEHYYKTGKEGTYMSKYVYADGAVVWGIARSTS